MSKEFNDMINQIRAEHPVLPDEMIREMIKKYQETGDTSIRDEIILSNVGLIMKIINQYKTYNSSMDIEDLFSESMECVNSAIDQFEFDRGAKFSTYAAIWIRQGIMRAIDTQGNTIRLPVYIKDKINKVKKYINQHPMENLSVEEIAKATDVSKDIVEYALLSSEYILSLNETYGDEGIEMGDFIPSDDNLDDILEKNEIKDTVQLAVLNALTEKEQDIIQKRFGLNGQPVMTLEELGEQYHVTRERIRQLEIKALYKLRRCAQLRNIRSYR